MSTHFKHLRSHTDTLKQEKQDSHHFMFAAVLPIHLNVCHNSTACLYNWLASHRKLCTARCMPLVLASRTSVHVHTATTKSPASSRLAQKRWIPQRNVSVRDDKTLSSMSSTPPFTDWSCFVDLSDVCQRLARGNHAHWPHHVTVLLLAKHHRCASSNWLAASMPKPLLKMSIAFGIPFPHSGLTSAHSKLTHGTLESLSLKFAIMQHLLKGFLRRRSNVISGLLFVLSSFSINSGSPAIRRLIWCGVQLILLTLIGCCSNCLPHHRWRH